MNFFPTDFENRMKVSLGAEYDAFAIAHQQETPVAIRVNPMKRALPVSGNIPWTTMGQYLEQRPSFTLDPSFHGGAYYVQEPSSMFLEQALRQTLDLAQPLRVLDLCAAPGGKSTHLLSLLSAESLLVTNEVIQSRATILSENMQKWGYPNVLVTNNDPSDFQRMPGYFDVMVIDAPCSGEGLFRKEPEAMNEWSVENAARCALRQRRILADVWPALREGGILIYCTCTFNEEENETNLAWLSGQQGAESLTLQTPAAWGVREQQHGAIRGYHFFPHQTRGEGFFLSVLRKNAAETPSRMKSRFSFATPNAKVTSQLHEWLMAGVPMKFITHEDLVMMIPSAAADEIAWLSEKVKVITKGTALAAVKHEKLVPEHAAALSIRLRRDHFEYFQTTTEQAIAFLRKDNTLDAGGRRGFALVMHEELPLGWVNLLGNRLNNLYPASWRIRMGS